ncbi:hypothetical protein CATMQ487_30130 [Sphaerotilus microaerophilus]|uniref:Uncharacterized protein n=2 Tax=Sphaerotilus microaerophilus TaxID=2914710 RepID=A0ABN6PPT5_9BURK|nr:hypothetical protein CATMQ487_30130 [Sphaerotilus sp. FB-5]
MVSPAQSLHDVVMARSHEVQVLLLAMQGAAIEEMSLLLTPDDAERARQRVSSRLRAMVARLRLEPDDDAQLAAGVVSVLSKMQSREAIGSN